GNGIPPAEQPLRRHQGVGHPLLPLHGREPPAPAPDAPPLLDLRAVGRTGASPPDARLSRPRGRAPAARRPGDGPRLRPRRRRSRGLPARGESRRPTSPTSSPDGTTRPGGRRSGATIS